jgi:acyl-CoA thioester hydrolase
MNRNSLDGIRTEPRHSQTFFDADDAASDSLTSTAMRIEVRESDISVIGYIDAVSYLRWVQDAVVLHWQRFAPATAQASTLWIAVRHVINYRSVGRWQDNVVVRTTIKRLKGVRAVFSTDIVSGDRCLADIESTWVSLGAASGQPKALDQDVVRLFARQHPPSK